MTFGYVLPYYSYSFYFISDELKQNKTSQISTNREIRVRMPVGTTKQGFTAPPVTEILSPADHSSDPI